MISTAVISLYYHPEADAQVWAAASVAALVPTSFVLQTRFGLNYSFPAQAYDSSTQPQRLLPDPAKFFGPLRHGHGGDEPGRFIWRNQPAFALGPRGGKREPAFPKNSALSRQSQTRGPLFSERRSFTRGHVRS